MQFPPICAILGCIVQKGILVKFYIVVFICFDLMLFCGLFDAFVVFFKEYYSCCFNNKVYFLFDLILFACPVINFFFVANATFRFSLLKDLLQFYVQHVQYVAKCRYIRRLTSADHRPGGAAPGSLTDGSLDHGCGQQ